MTGIHLFSKDLRTVDNEALSMILNKLKVIEGENCILLFHLDTNQLVKKSEEWHRSKNAIRFMLQSIEDLNNCLGNSLHVIFGDRVDLYSYIEKISAVRGVKYLSKNMDYSKYSVDKEEEIRKLCSKLHITFLEGHADQTIIDTSLLLKDNNIPYTTFSHFYNKLKKNINATAVKSKFKVKIELNKLIKPDMDYCWDRQLSLICESLGFNKSELLNIDLWKSKEIFYGGRKKGLERLNTLTSKDNKKLSIQNFIERDNMSSDRGLNISSYLNFGCISSREVIEMFKPAPEELFKQMAWRDFYLCILRFNKKSKEYIWLDDRYNNLEWRNTDSELFRKEWEDFINCSTGCLIIDAAMSELKQTGFMNNRARLLWATFAVKYIQSNPFDKTFGAISLYSRYLIDCSTSQNKMNFEWIISSLDIGGRRFAKRGESPLSGRVISLDNKHTLKKYNAYDYIRKWLPKYRDTGDKELSKIEPSINLKKRYQEYCNMFKTT